MDSFGLKANKKNEGRSNRNVFNDPKNHRNHEFGWLVNKEQKGPTKESRVRVSKNGKTDTNIAPLLETDLNHHPINEHLKIIYVNINSLPRDILR
jgi:hypothetical protein